MLDNPDYPGNQWRCAKCQTIIRLYHPIVCGTCGNSHLVLDRGIMPVEVDKAANQRASSRKWYFEKVVKPRLSKIRRNDAEYQNNQN